MTFESKSPRPRAWREKAHNAQCPESTRKARKRTSTFLEAKLEVTTPQLGSDLPEPRLHVSQAARRTQSPPDASINTLPSIGEPASCVWTTLTLPSFLSRTNHAHPLPKCPAAAAVNSRLKLSYEPNEESIKEARGPVGAGVASADLGGARDWNPKEGLSLTA